jgi:hypothetical protein
MCPNCQEPMLFDAPVPCALCDLTISAPYTCVMPSHRHNVCETCYSALPVHLRLRSPLRFSRLLWMVGNGQGARQWQGGPPIHRAKAQVRWVHQEHGRVVVVDMPPMRVRLLHQLRGCDTARSLACRLGRQCSLLLALGSAKPSLFVLDMLLRGLHGNAHIVRRNFCWREPLLVSPQQFCLNAYHGCCCASTPPMPPATGTKVIILVCCPCIGLSTSFAMGREDNELIFLQGRLRLAVVLRCLPPQVSRSTWLPHSRLRSRPPSND